MKNLITNCSLGENDLINWNTISPESKRKIISVLCYGLLGVIVIPIVVNYLVGVNDTQMSWIGFFGSYLGGLGSALIASLVAYKIAKIQADNNHKEQMLMLKGELDNQQQKAENDLQFIKKQYEDNVSQKQLEYDNQLKQKQIEHERQEQ